MSLDHSATKQEDVTAAYQQDVDMEQTPPTKASYKSFKKKYRKTMITFEEKMRESNDVFKEEQKMLDITRRLVEQNDQILELLRDLNECPELAPAHRYDLDITASSDKTRNGDSSSTDYDVPTARATLAEARQELKVGELTPIEYKRLEESILRNPAFAPAKGYLPLLSVPHSHVADTEGFSPKDESNVGFISTTQEEQYLRELDAYLAGETTTKRPSSYGSNVKSGERSVERDRDTALRNPVSVYNWLRKHQPQVFLQDKENDGEKTTNKASNARSSKRGSMQIKPDPEMYDDEGIALEPKSSRGKRKRGAGDDDGGYRPKGGGTRSAKRKRSEGGARNSKKFDTPG